MAPAALASSAMALQLPSRTPAHGGLGVGAEILGASLLACALIVAVTMTLDRRRAARRPELVEDEWRARRLMDELCPSGWSCTLMIYARGLPLPPDAPDVDRPLVCLEWAELEPEEDGSTRVAVSRRLWATSVRAALDGMVADRRLDRTLEGIENSGPSAPGGFG